MVGLLILIVTLIFTCAIGFIIIWNKLDKKPIPDIKLTVNLPKSDISLTVPDQQFVDGNIVKEIPPEFTTNPMDYINKTKTKAHIKWDSQEQNPTG